MLHAVTEWRWRLSEWTKNYTKHFLSFVIVLHKKKLCFWFTDWMVRSVGFHRLQNIRPDVAGQCCWICSVECSIVKWPVEYFGLFYCPLNSGLRNNELLKYSVHRISEVLGFWNSGINKIYNYCIHIIIIYTIHYRYTPCMFFQHTYILL